MRLLWLPSAASGIRSPPPAPIPAHRASPVAGHPRTPHTLAGRLAEFALIPRCLFALSAPRPRFSLSAFLSLFLQPGGVLGSAPHSTGLACVRPTLLPAP